eukprot:TRINITY_DN121169_c0_g1_i1.p1 TRINITY_DN121169_c0_g1~~TRINITY_DN121169_c0_g1_i1.p1  ORF type:complete len:346 (+),score=60.01 TRINITY_DN121169_c0_g1_i1:78-1115(+)
MGLIFSECSKIVAIEDVPHDEGEFQKGPRLTLNITSGGEQAAEPSLGTYLAPFKVGASVGIYKIEPVKTWAALNGRFEATARQKGQQASKLNVAWPEGSSRCALARRHYKVEVLAPDGQGGIIQSTMLLQVIADKQHRRTEAVNQDIVDARDVAAHAHRFNLHLHRSLVDPDGTCAGHPDLPNIKVSVPLGCQVTGSLSPEIANQGDTVLLLPYSENEVRKFVFDGSEEFFEVPQAFFHYAAYQTGGGQCLADLQGSELDDGSFLLVDPCLLRAPQMGVGDLLASIVPGASGGAADGPSPERFETCHAKCGQLCKTFDPQRRVAHQKRGACGLSCGAGMPGAAGA